MIGAGFGGLAVARNLLGTPVSVLLIDANNFHTFQPLLYQVATAGLDGDEVSQPVRAIVRRGRRRRRTGNVRFRMGRAVAVDLARRTVAARGWRHRRLRLAGDGGRRRAPRLRRAGRRRPHPRAEAPRRCAVDPRPCARRLRASGDRAVVGRRRCPRCRDLWRWGHRRRAGRRPARAVHQRDGQGLPRPARSNRPGSCSSSSPTACCRRSTRARRSGLGAPWSGAASRCSSASASPPSARTGSS